MILFSLAMAARPTIVAYHVRDVVVLDVNATHGALRVVHEKPHENAGSGFDRCGYAGMKDHPGAGVDLYVVEHATGTLERFTVYAAVVQKAAYQGEELEPCTPHEASVASLDQAKARMREVGLDPTRKPAGSKTVQVADRQPPLEHAVERVWEEGDLSVSLTWTASLGGKPLHTATFAYSPSMAGRGELVRHPAWQTPGGVVLLEHWRESNMRGSRDTLAFTPILAVSP